MMQPGRKYTTANTQYRYGFNGKELDKEVSATTTYDYGFRIYSPGLRRFLSVDPLTKSYSWYSPYHFGGNSPIRNNDLDGAEPLDYSSKWQWRNIFNSKTGTSNGKTLFVDDSKLGLVSVEGVYDNITKQTWFIYQDNQAFYYYLKNDNGDHGTIRYEKEGNHNIVDGHFERFDPLEEVDRKNTNRFLDNFSIAVAGGFASIAAAPVLPYVARTLVNTSGFTSATLQAELGRRTGAAAADAAFQGLQLLSGSQDKFNYGSAMGSFLTSNPFGAAVWTTAGEVANNEAKSSADLFTNFSFNLGGNLLGDRATKGLIKNSANSSDPIMNAINSFLGNSSGAAGAYIGSTYKNLNSTTNDKKQ